MAEDEVLTTDQGRQVGWFARGPDGGKPVLYVHGWPGSRYEQRYIPDEVLERFGVRLVSVDRPGWGNTDPLHGERSEKTGDVIAVADALGIGRFPVMGISCGGSHVLTLAAVAPDRVERVVLVCSQMPYDAPEAIVTLEPDQLAYLSKCRDGRTDELVRDCEDDRAALLEDPLAELEGWFVSFSEPERAWAHTPRLREVWDRDLREGFRRSAEGHIEDNLTTVRPFDVDVSTITCPVRAVHGSADTWEPLPNLNRFLAVIPDTDLILIDGKNHLGPLMYPDLLVSLAMD